MFTNLINVLLSQSVAYTLFGLTFLCFLIWLIDQLFLENYKREKAHLPKNLINKVCGLFPYLLFLSALRVVLILCQGLDFDFNLILVPVTLFFLCIILIDKVIYKDRKQLGKGQERSVISNSYDFFPILAFVLIVRSFIVEPFNIPSSSMVPTLYTGDFIAVNKSAYGVRLPLVNTKILDTGHPQRGDVVVFRYPENTKIYYIKRVIGLPGDTVNYDNGVLFINGKEVPTQVVGFNADQALVQGLYPKGTAFNGQQLDASQAKQLSQQEEEMVIYAQETIGEHTHLIRDVKDFESAGLPNATFLREHSPNVVETEGKQWQVTVPENSYFVMGDNRDRSGDSRFWGFVADEDLSGKAVYVWMHKKPGLKMPTFSRNGSIQ